MVLRRTLLGGLVLGLPMPRLFTGSAAADTRPTAVVATSAGLVRGHRLGGGAVFAGIPYAAPPVGDRRFLPPEPPKGWTGVRDAYVPGPAAPQSVSRIEAVVGPVRLTAKAEDCLSVNVWSTGLRERRPVLVFLHGGAYVSGSGGQDWYDGTGLSDLGDIVVVTINYRLGALGFLYPGGLADDMGAGNAGLRDQLAALRWVRDNIANFGGDPDQVTLAGQSAGALSALAMMSSPHAAGLFHRVVLQSTPTGIRPQSQQEATVFIEKYLQFLGLRPDQVHQLRTLPVDDLLRAKGALMGTAPPLRLAPPFQLVADGDLVAADLLGTSGWARGIDRLIGTTRDEANAWAVPDPRLNGVDRTGAITVARDFLGDASEAEYDRVSQGVPEASPNEVLRLLTTDFFFQRDVSTVAAGAPRSYVYRFDWAPTESRFVACHCLDLPFMFGTVAAWRAAPMLAGAIPAEEAALTADMSAALAAFVRSGNPAHAGIPAWPTHHDGGAVMRFDTAAAVHR